MLQGMQDDSAGSALPCLPCAIAVASAAARAPKICLVALA